MLHKTVRELFPKSKEKQRELFDLISGQLNIKIYTNWYSVKETDIIHAGMALLIERKLRRISYQSVTYNYHEHDWNIWKFDHFSAPRELWKDVHYQKQLFHFIGQQTGMKELEGWYNVAVNSIMQKGSTVSLLLNAYYGGYMVKALQTIYPNS